MMKNKKPEIRFKGFSEEWAEKMVAELGEIVTGSTPSTADKSNYNGKYLFVSPADIQSNRYIENTLTTLSEKGFNKGRILKEGSTLFVSIGSTIGKVAQIKEKATTNQQINAIVPNTNYDDDFVLSLLSNRSKHIKGLAATQAVPIINKTSFSNVEIIIPADKTEQTQIGNFFKNLDNLITLHQRKYEKLGILKKAMLEKMFPKNGKDVPEIRFKGFEGAWEERKLGEMADSVGYGLNAAAIDYDGVNKYIRITDIDDKSREFDTDALTSPNTNLVLADNYKLNEGDILFARTGASVGKSYYYKATDGLVYFAGFLIRVRLKPEFNTVFIFQNTLTHKYDIFIKLTSQRSGQPGVNAQEYSNYKIMMPEFEEQEKIGNYFKNLDNLLTLHQGELGKLKNLKKAMLGKMFV